METTVDPSRRASEPHHHVQPKYPEPELRYRRNTEATALHRVRSRPEDYKNKPRPDKLVEYICFDSQNRPVKCDEAPEEQRPSTRRRERSSRSRRYDASVDNDDNNSESSHSEDELTLPSNYHSPSGRGGSRSGSGRAEARPEAQPDVQPENYRADSPPPPPPPASSTRQRSHSPRNQSLHQRQHQHQSRYLQPFDRRQSVYPEQRRRSWHGPDVDDDYFEKEPITRHNTYNHTEAPYDSRTHQRRHRDSDQHMSSPSLSSETASHLIAQVAEHLQTHKSAYSRKHGDGSELVSELMGQVVRKVADGSLNGDMMKEIVREVQRVL